MRILPYDPYRGDYPPNIEHPDHNSKFASFSASFVAGFIASLAYWQEAKVAFLYNSVIVSAALGCMWYFMLEYHNLLLRRIAYNRDVRQHKYQEGDLPTLGARFLVFCLLFIVTILTYLIFSHIYSLIPKFML